MPGVLNNDSASTTPYSQTNGDGVHRTKSTKTKQIFLDMSNDPVGMSPSGLGLLLSRRKKPFLDLFTTLMVLCSLTCVDQK